MMNHVGAFIKSIVFKEKPGEGARATVAPEFMTGVLKSKSFQANKRKELVFLEYLLCARFWTNPGARERSKPSMCPDSGREAFTDCSFKAQRAAAWEFRTCADIHWGTWH